MAIFPTKIHDEYNASNHMEFVMDQDSDVALLPGLDTCAPGSKATSIASGNVFYLTTFGFWTKSTKALVTEELRVDKPGTYAADEGKAFNPVIVAIEGGVIKENFSLNYDELKSYIRTNCADIDHSKIVLDSIELLPYGGGSLSGGYQCSATYFRLVSILDAYIIMFVQYDIDNDDFRGYQYTYDDVSDTCEFRALSDAQMSQMNFSVRFTAYTLS